MVHICTYDFETSNKNPNLAHPLQLAWILEDTKHIKEKEQYSFRIIFPKFWDNCTEAEKGALRFNGIGGFDEIKNPNMLVSERLELFKKVAKFDKDKYYITIEEHNEISRESLGICKLFIKSITNYGGIDILSGYNIEAFDNVILTNWFKQYYGSDFFTFIKPKFNDVYLNYLRLGQQEKLVLPDERIIKVVVSSWGNRYFILTGSEMSEEQGLLKLQNLVPLLFPGVNLNFHQALDDVKATRKARLYFEEKFQKDNLEISSLECECCSCGRVLELTEGFEISLSIKVCETVSCMKNYLMQMRENKGLEVPAGWNSKEED